MELVSTSRWGNDDGASDKLVLWSEVLGARESSEFVCVWDPLMDGDVVKMVLGRVPERGPAVLRGHCRFASKNRTYPGVQKTVQEDEV